MHAILRMYVISCLSFLLIGCVSPMYFYETEKISLTVEARPDSSQPVQGSLGIKQRLALIAPKKNLNDSNKGDDGEAISAITSFSFKIMPKPGNLFDPLVIQTAFVTGEAAKLEESLVQKVAEAITVGNLSAKQSFATNKIVEKLFSADNKLDKKKLEDFLRCAGFNENEVRNYVNKYQDKDLNDFKTAFKEDFTWEASRYLDKCGTFLGG